MAIIPLDEKPHFPTRLMYSQADSVTGTTANHSVVVRAPRIITISGLAGTAAINVYAKVHNDSEPVLASTVDASGESAVAVTFDPRFNFVWFEVTDQGSGTIVAYSQS